MAVFSNDKFPILGLAWRAAASLKGALERPLAKRACAVAGGSWTDVISSRPETPDDRSRLNQFADFVGRDGQCNLLAIGRAFGEGLGELFDLI